MCSLDVESVVHKQATKEDGWQERTLIDYWLRGRERAGKHDHEQDEEGCDLLKQFGEPELDTVLSARLISKTVLVPFV